jgi:hypothetical protein
MVNWKAAMFAVAMMLLFPALGMALSRWPYEIIEAIKWLTAIFAVAFGLWLFYQMGGRVFPEET